MSIWFPLRVNHEIIGFFEAVRIEGDAFPDSMNTYRVEVIDNGIHAPEEGRNCEFTIEHRYGDGSWELVRKCLDELPRQGWNEISGQESSDPE